MTQTPRLVDRVRRSIRLKLLALALLPVAIILPIGLAGLIAWGAAFTYDQLYIKVNTDLAVAHDVFERMQQDHLNQLGRLGESYVFRNAMARDDQPTLDALTENLKTTAGFDFLRIVRQHQTPALLSNRPGVGIEIIAPEELKTLDSALPDAVRLPLLKTKRAQPTERRYEDRAMVIRARHPILAADGSVIAVLDGGVLLNNNFALVDAIRDLVYGPGSLPAGSIGTVTVFLDDVRISTNVPRQEGVRALGTRVSAEVSQTVLGRGEKWIDRAFVVNAWYISAYEPIVDVDGKRVGILYAGYLEAPFRAALWKTLGLVLLLLLALLGLYALLAIRGAKSIFRPVEQISAVVRATRDGERRRIGVVASRDELAELAHQFDDMLDRLEQQTGQIQDWADRMEAKVDERTVELKQRNRELERTITILRKTRRQLVMAEKLAALGELTAGVAHEINNPTQVMLGNLDVLTAELGDRLEPVRPEIELIVEQIYRIQGIIEKLLKYARPSDYAGHLAEIDVNNVVGDTIALTMHLQKRHEFTVRLQLEASTAVTINAQELQQVLVNLVTNAVHALPEHDGRIDLATRDWEGRGVIITVTDNGCGMDAEQCSQVFNPFFSTKQEGEGTGLGLSVSYGLIRRYGGDITVISQPGQGSEFRVWLLREPVMTEDAETLAGQLHGIGNSESDQDDGETDDYADRTAMR